MLYGKVLWAAIAAQDLPYEQLCLCCGSAEHPLDLFFAKESSTFWVYPSLPYTSSALECTRL